MNKELNKEILTYIYKRYIKGNKNKLIKIELVFVDKCEDVSSAIRTEKDKDKKPMCVKLTTRLPSMYLYNDKLNKKSFNELNLNRYFKDLGIKRTRYKVACNVLESLHEIGHTQFCYEIIKNEPTIEDMRNAYTNFRITSNASSNSINRFLKHLNHMQKYRNSYLESVADRFSYMEFPTVWKLVEKKFLSDDNVIL